MVYSLLILRRFRNDRWFNMIEEVKSSYRDRFVFIYIFNFPRTRNFKTEKSRLDRRLFLRGTRNEREITLIPLLSRLKYKHATRILAWLITSGQGSEGIKYFSPSKGSRPAFFFVHEPFRDPPSIPPLLNIVPFVSPVSSTDQTSSFSRLLCPPSYHPPILLSSCAPSSSLYYSFIPAHHLYLVSRATFSLFDNGKNLGGRGRERRKKAHARCCQSRRVFFRLSQTPNARLGFRLTDNRRGEDSLIGGETPLGPRFITFLARCQTILSVPFSVYTPLFLPPWFILNSLMTRSRMMYDGVASRVE